MSTSAISSSLLGVATSSSTSSTTSSSTTDFITLLLKELENQDPTDPMDTSELVSQFSTLTQVQQGESMINYLETMTEYSSSVNSAQAVSCIGKTVTADTSSIAVSSGAAETLSFTLADDASEATITIYDENGKEVTALECGDIAAGTVSVTWDGKDSSGNTVDDGTYSFTVSASDADGKSVTASTSVTAAITGVLYNGGTTYLVTSDGSKIAYGDVTAVSST